MALGSERKGESMGDTVVRRYGGRRVEGMSGIEQYTWRRV